MPFEKQTITKWTSYGYFITDPPYSAVMKTISCCLAKKFSTETGSPWTLTLWLNMIVKEHV